jgi:hypothetical protein
MKETRTKFETTLTSDDFDFIIESLNDASLEIAEKKEAKKEDVFNRIKDELQGVQQALQSSHTVSIVPLSVRTPELGDEPTQLHQITDTVEAHLRRAHEETAQATKALAQAEEDRKEQRSATERENIALQVNWDEEKEKLQQSKEQLLTKQLKVKEMVHKALRSMTVVEVKNEERVPQ